MLVTRFYLVIKTVVTSCCLQTTHCRWQIIIYFWRIHYTSLALVHSLCHCLIMSIKRTLRWTTAAFDQLLGIGKSSGHRGFTSLHITLKLFSTLIQHVKWFAVSKNYNTRTQDMNKDSRPNIVNCCRWLSWWNMAQLTILAGKLNSLCHFIQFIDWH